MTWESFTQRLEAWGIFQSDVLGPFPIAKNPPEHQLPGTAQRRDPTTGAGDPDLPQRRLRNPSHWSPPVGVP